MGKAMVNATNLVAHVTLVAHLNLKIIVAFVLNLIVVVLPCGTL
jgi:hypothetical protein